MNRNNGKSHININFKQSGSRTQPIAHSQHPHLLRRSKNSAAIRASQEILEVTSARAKLNNQQNQQASQPPRYLHQVLGRKPPKHYTRRPQLTRKMITTTLKRNPQYSTEKKAPKKVTFDISSQPKTVYGSVNSQKDISSIQALSAFRRNLNTTDRGLFGGMNTPATRNPYTSNLTAASENFDVLGSAQLFLGQGMQSFERGFANPHEEWARNEEILTNVAPPTSQTGHQVDIDLDKCLSINTRLGSDAIKAKTANQTVPLLLNLKEVNFENLGVEVDSKIDLVCVIDISGSMNGLKLDYVRRTMKKLLKFLGNGHRLAIVLFDDEAQTYMNFKLVNPANIGKINLIIDSILTGGGTNITAGVHEAQRLLGRRLSKNPISCIFLLSDGEHNEGPISMELLYNNDVERARCEYTLTSFGYGDDHDAHLLQEMSEKKGGNYYFIDEISEVEQCFADSLAMVTSIIGQNIRATLKLNPTPLFPEIRVEKTFGPYWKSESPIESTVKLNSFYSGFNKNFLCLIGLNPLKQGQVTQETEIVLGDLELKIDTLDTPAQTKTFRRRITLRVLPEDSQEIIPENQIVHEQLTRVQGAETIELADKLNDEGRYVEALEAIKTFSYHLGNKSYREKELFSKLKGSLEKQRELISNNKNGRANIYKTANFSMQNKNIYMNELSAPKWSQGLYQNRKMARMSAIS